MTPPSPGISARGALLDTSGSAASGSGREPERMTARGPRCDARRSVREVAGPEDRRLQGDEGRGGIVERRRARDRVYRARKRARLSDTPSRRAKTMAETRPARP